MKIRLQKRFVNKTLHHYNEEMSRAFPGLTPDHLANLYRVQDFVKDYQNQRHLAEPQSVYWSLPVTVRVSKTPDGHSVFEALVEPEYETENLLYTDFDQF